MAITKRAWVYVIGVWILATIYGASTLYQAHITLNEWLTFIVLASMATIAQLYKTEAPNHVLFYATPVFLFAAVLLLDPALFVMLVITYNLIEWVKERLLNSPHLRDWYIQPFNIATEITAGLTTYWFYDMLSLRLSGFGTFAAAVTAVLSAMAFVSISYAMLGLVLILARNKTWRQTGLLDGETFLSDLILLLLGYVVAVLWEINPWYTLIAISPLVLMYRALMVPQLMEEAHTDPKTGLHNARYYARRYDEEIQRAERTGRPLALIMADLDYLRTINNTYGHLAGDSVLLGVAKHIRATIREADLAARFGGEEFTIVLPDTQREQAREIAERLRRTIAEATYSVETQPDPIRATMSFGIACYPEDGDTGTALTFQADIAVYQAKVTGRNRVVCVADLPAEVRAAGIPVRAAETAPALPVPSPISHTTTPEATPKPAATSAEPIAAPSAAQQPAPGPEPLPLAVATPKASSAAAALPVKQPALLWLFTGGVIGLSAGLSLYGATQGVPHMWLPFLVTIIVLAAVAELLQIDLYGNDGVSVSVATLVAGSLLCGLTGATLTAAAIAFAGGIVRWRNRANAPFYTDALNGAISMISGSSIAILVSQSGLSLNAGNLPSLTALMIPIGLAFALVNTGLLATRHSLQFGQPLVAIWRERYQWLTVHHIVLCMLGLFLTIAYVTFGFFGLVTFILPVAMMHYVEKQYIERTREHVLRLEQLNQQLSRKNTETTHASVVVQQLNQELRYASTSVARLNDELFETLAKIIDTHDPSMSSHSTRVARLAVALGKRIGVPDAEIVGLRRAALLHDIGKIGVSEAILQKPARLTPREYETVKTHVSLGVAMLESAQSLRSLIPMVRHHHERWDGRGYPDQIASAAIPLGARVIAICDAVDVMSVDRPYHHAMPAHEVIAELRRSSSAHFDPALVTAMIELIEDGLLEPAETEGLTTLAI